MNSYFLVNQKYIIVKLNRTNNSFESVLLMNRPKSLRVRAFHESFTKLTHWISQVTVSDRLTHWLNCYLLLFSVMSVVKRSIFVVCRLLKGLVKPKMKTPSSFSLPHDVQNLLTFFNLQNTNYNFEECCLPKILVTLFPNIIYILL